MVWISKLSASTDRVGFSDFPNSKIQWVPAEAEQFANLTDAVQQAEFGIRTLNRFPLTVHPDLFRYSTGPTVMFEFARAPP